ncbi:MAG: hypothetical protein JWQ10_1818, partial [Herbaspirillum sp.]|nr:hypothetical protein [Herbaspirillum sp.]
MDMKTKDAWVQLCQVEDIPLLG